MSNLAPIKPYNSKQLSQLYGIGKDALRAWLKLVPQELLGKQVGRNWNVKQVTLLFNHFGHPEIEKTNPK